MNIVITKHGLDRWRERFSKAGNEEIVHIRKYLLPAIAVQGEPPQGYSFYKNEDKLFLLDRSKDLVTIITVMPTPKELIGYNFVMPEFENKSQKREYLKQQLNIAIGIRNIHRDKYWYSVVKEIELKLSELRKERIKDNEIKAERNSEIRRSKRKVLDFFANRNPNEEVEFIEEVEDVSRIQMECMGNNG